MHEYYVYRDRKFIGTVFATTIMHALAAARAQYAIGTWPLTVKRIERVA